MTDAPTERARNLALELLRRVRRGAFLAPTLSQALDSSGLEVRDRAFVTDLSYGAVRRLPWLEAALASRLRSPAALPEVVVDALTLGTFEILVRGTPRRAAVHSWVEVVKALSPGLAGLTNAVLRRVEAPTALDDATTYALPAWLWQRFVEALGVEGARLAAAGMLEPEPLWLSTYAEYAEERLEREGFEISARPFADSFGVRSPGPLATTAAFRDGVIQPQNPSSTVPVRVLAPTQGERVLDLAAGRGIKTAQLASLGAAVTAVEIDGRRSVASRSNLARLGFSAEHVSADLLAPLELPPAPAVLLDAPCSGTGTLRGHPEIKLRLTEAELNKQVRLQARMLDRAADLVSAGGRLVYAVCSLTAAEGDGQVSAFLARRPEFHAADFASTTPSVATASGRYLLPVDGLDGFFVSRLERAAAL